MKIRKGFVSNSSSSSFLILFSDIKDFDKFKEFTGFRKFIRDLKSSIVAKDTKDNCIMYIRHLLHRYLSSVMEFHIGAVVTEKCKCSRYLEDPTEYHNLDFFCNHDVCIEDFWELSSEYNAHALKFEDKYLAAVDEKIESKLIESYKKTAYEKLYTDKRLDQIAEKYYNELKSKGILTFLEYFDYTDMGEYMETKFMPFLSKYPEDKFSIDCQSNH